MLAVIGIIVVVFVWRFLILTAAAVFQRAGLAPRAATFQARSALTGAGYTTGESEFVVNDPASREAASMLMLIGFVGPVTIIGLLGFGFLLPSSTDVTLRLSVLAGLIVVFLVLERTGVNERILERPARWAARVFGESPDPPWRVVGDHAMLVLPVSASTPSIGQRMGDRPFADPNLKVLGISRLNPDATRHIAVPSPNELIRSGDQFVLFGPVDTLSNLRTASGETKP